jgi:hypothetical protein
VVRFKRKKLFVDTSVQGALVIRAVTYWFYCLVTVAFMMTCWTIFASRPTSSLDLLRQVWGQCGPAFIASLLLLPLVIVDCLRTTNRFVGPLQRIRRTLRDLAAGKDVPFIAFRKGDFWSDLADDINRLNDRLKRLQLQQTPRSAAAVEQESLTDDQVEAAV